LRWTVRCDLDRAVALNAHSAVHTQCAHVVIARVFNGDKGSARLRRVTVRFTRIAIDQATPRSYRFSTDEFSTSFLYVSMSAMTSSWSTKYSLTETKSSSPCAIWFRGFTKFESMKCKRVEN
jgi:hypothetical protein